MPTYDKSASNDVALGDSLSRTMDYHPSVSNDVALAQVLARNVDYHLDTSNDVALDEGTPPLDLEVEPESDVLFAQAAWHHMRDVDAVNNIALEQVIVCGKDLNLSIEHTITFHQSGRNVKDGLASSDVLFEGECDIGYYLEQSITFASVASADASKAASNDVTLADAAVGNVTRSLSASNSLALTSYVLGYTDEEDRLYNPYNASGSSVPDDVTLTIGDTITLAQGVYSLELRKPEFGNSESLDTHRLIRESRGGDLMMHKFTPSKTTLNYECNMISPTKLAEYQTFIANTLGKEITLTDYEGRSWTGILFPGDSTQVRADVWVIRFSFIGELA